MMIKKPCGGRWWIQESQRRWWRWQHKQGWWRKQRSPMEARECRGQLEIIYLYSSLWWWLRGSWWLRWSWLWRYSPAGSYEHEYRRFTEADIAKEAIQDAPTVVDHDYDDGNEHHKMKKDFIRILLQNFMLIYQVIFGRPKSFKGTKICFTRVGRRYLINLITLRQSDFRFSAV